MAARRRLRALRARRGAAREVRRVVAATGDDKANLVVSLLAKTEFGVPRTVARVNNPKNEWMFDESWGVDVAVSTPRLMTALIEEAVSVGDLVRHLPVPAGPGDDGRHDAARRVAVRGPPCRRPGVPDRQRAGGIIRENRPIAPSRDGALEARDELLFLTTTEQEDRLQDLVAPGERPPPTARAESGRPRSFLLTRGRASGQATRVDRECDRASGWRPWP